MDDLEDLKVVRLIKDTKVPISKDTKVPISKDTKVPISKDNEENKQEISSQLIDDGTSSDRVNNIGKVFFKPTFDEDEEIEEEVDGYDEELQKNVSYIGRLEQQQQITTEYDSLFIWYTTSPLWRRFTLQILAFLIFILFIQIFSLLLSIYLIIFPYKVPDPYICNTAQCVEIAAWLNRTMNTSVDPCDNFYKYVCGNYREGTDNENIKDSLTDSNDFILFRTALADKQERLMYGQMFRDTHHNPIYRQIRKFFHSCMNYTARNEQGETPFVEMLHEMGLNLDHPTKNSSEILYEYWTYTGENGFVPMRLYVNPYDGFRLIVIDGLKNAIINDYFNTKSVEGEKDYVWQEIRKILKISNYTVEQLAETFFNIYGNLAKQQNLTQHQQLADYIPNKDNIDGFNCDVFANKFDPNSVKFNNEVLLKERLTNICPREEDGEKFTAFFCNGGFTEILRQTKENFPNWTPDISYKLFWIFYLFKNEVKGFSPITIKRLSEYEKFEAYASRGPECLRSLKRNMPHLLHERLMQILKVSQKQVDEAAQKFTEFHGLLEKWLHDPIREKTFGPKTLALYRESIKAYTPKLISPRFTLETLELYGYKKTAELINEYQYLENIRILRNSLAELDRNLWMHIGKYYLPLNAFRFQYVLQEAVRTEDVFRPRASNVVLMPAILYTSLFSDDSIPALQYGGIWAYLSSLTAEKWKVEAFIRRDGDINEGIDLRNCSKFEEGKITSYPFADARKEYNEAVWQSLVIELLFEAYQNDKQKRNKPGAKFAYKRLIGMDYNEEQLLFLKLVRHQCNSLSWTADELLTGLFQSQAFRKTWNCPIGSNMVARTNCYFREYET